MWKKILSPTLLLFLVFAPIVGSAASESSLNIPTTGVINYTSFSNPSWVSSDAQIIAETDMTDISLSGTYRQGIQEWYPTVHTWISRIDDTAIVQHPVDSSKKAMEITFDGLISGGGASRPNFHVFLNEPNTLTEGINEIWVETKYYFPTSFSSPLGWFIFADVAEQYTNGEFVFDANIMLQSDDSITLNIRQRSSASAAWVYIAQIEFPIALIKGQVFTLKYHVLRHPSNGVIEIWINENEMVNYVGQTCTVTANTPWRITPLDHYCAAGSPITTNYLTYFRMWGR